MIQMQAFDGAGPGGQFRVKSRANAEYEERDMANITSREVIFKKRPVGVPDDSCFEIVDRDLDAPADGEVLVRNLYMSVDPYMRGRMSDAKSYAAGFELGEPLNGGAIGEVISSNFEGLAEGDIVQNGLGWRTMFAAPGNTLGKLEPAEGISISDYLGVLGGTGFTAYVGLFRIGEMKDGDVVFVSGAAGAVGLVAGQIAKLKDCTVIGSAGSDKKIAWCQSEAGFDHVFNYKTESAHDALPRLAPDGIDVYFDNVGGEQLEAAIANMKPFGHLAECGMISGYNATELPPGPNTIMEMVRRKLTMRGFIVSDHGDMRPQFLTDMTEWIKDRKVKGRETILEGIDNAPAAFIGLFSGANDGKMLVKLS